MIYTKTLPDYSDGLSASLTCGDAVVMLLISHNKTMNELHNNFEQRCKEKARATPIVTPEGTFDRTYDYVEHDDTGALKEMRQRFLEIDVPYVTIIYNDYEPLKGPLRIGGWYCVEDNSMRLRFVDEQTVEVDV